MMRYMLYPRVLAAGAVLAVAAYVAAYLHLAAVPSVPGSGWVRNWLIAWLIVGIYAGALAGTVTQEAGYDLVGDIITGIIGALIGGLVGLAPGWHTFVDVILKVQRLSVDLAADVAELDINPLVVRPRGAVALDALVVRK